MKEGNKVEASKLWNNFIEQYPQYQNQTYESWGYGADPDELATLTLNGTKTATASGYELYGIENEPLPEVGEFNVILDGQDNAICITRTTKVYVVPFKEVTESHAFKEGEGDRSLAYWRRVHIEFFEKAYQEGGISFQPDSKVVCEEFKRIFPEVNDGN